MVDPTDTVWTILENADEPLFIHQIVERTQDVHDAEEVERALEHWRGQGTVVKDAEGRWSWQGTPR